MDPSGAVTVLAGVTSQGQGLETTLAQLVASELGVPVETVRVVLGDTDATPFGLGAFASRQAVIGGGAALRARPGGARQDHAHRRARAGGGRRRSRRGRGPGERARRAGSRRDAGARSRGSRTSRRIGCRPISEPGLDATRFYDPIRGTFAAGAQAAIVHVEPETGVITIRRWVCVEDTGRVINPLIVEGQVHGAIAQGIGGALTEHLIYDDAGQLLTGTFMEYAMPTASVIPAVRDRAHRGARRQSRGRARCRRGRHARAGGGAGQRGRRRAGPARRRAGCAAAHAVPAVGRLRVGRHAPAPRRSRCVAVPTTSRACGTGAPCSSTAPGSTTSPSTRPSLRRSGASPPPGISPAPPRPRPITTFVDPATGRRHSAMWLVPRSADDLGARRRVHRLWAEPSFGLMGRTPDHVACVLSAFAGWRQLFDRGGARFGDNVVRFYARARDEELYVAYGIVPLQIDRSQPAHRQPEPFLYPGVVAETGRRHRVRGSHGITTSAVLADWLFVSYITPLAGRGRGLRAVVRHAGGRCRPPHPPAAALRADGDQRLRLSAVLALRRGRHHRGLRRRLRAVGAGVRRIATSAWSTPSSTSRPRTRWPTSSRWCASP